MVNWSRVNWQGVPQGKSAKYIIAARRDRCGMLACEDSSRPRTKIVTVRISRFGRATMEPSPAARVPAYQDPGHRCPCPATGLTARNDTAT